MKSRLFSRGYDLGTFSQKRYERYLQSELKDEALAPAADYYDSEIMHLIVEDENKKTEQKTAATPLVKYTVAPQKEQCILPSGKFQETWKSFHPQVVKRITNFLPLGSIVALMETCKDFYAEFGDSIWEERLEKRLKIAIKQRPALPNLDFIKNLHKSKQFNLQHPQFMSSHLLEKTSKIGTLTLTRDIVDFQPIKSVGLLEKLRILAPTNITISLFLSHDVEKNEINLWTILERKNEISSLRIRKLQFAPEKQIVSCKFINEECFIIQLKEVQTTSEEVSCGYEILIFDIYAELVRIENLANNQPTLSNHKICLNYKSASETPVTPIQNQDGSNLSDLEINGKAPSEFSFALDPQGRIIFYGQGEGEQNLMILIYDTKAGKLEKIHSLTSKIPLLTIQVPHQKTQDSVEMFLIYDDLKIEILKYSTTEKSFSSQELSYLEKEREPVHLTEEQEEITKFHKCRYGSFRDRDGKTIEYLITLHEKRFYYIDLQSKSAHRLLTLAQRVPPEATDDQTILECVNLMDWNIHENILIMTIDYLTLVTLVLDSNGQINELVKDSNLLVPYAKMPKAPRSEWPSFGNILQTRMPPLIVFNNSYLIIINFPYIEQSFQVYIIPFQSYLIWKGLANFEYKSFREKLEKVMWEVRSNDIFEKESSTFFKKINNSPNLPDLVKFEDNKLLIKLNLNLFFDLQSQTNLQTIPTYNQKSHETKWEISISEKLHLLTSTIIGGKETKAKKKQQQNSKNHLVFFKSNPNHEPKNQLGTENYDGCSGYRGGSDVNQRVLKKYRRKKSLEETKQDHESSEDEKEQIHKSSKKKDEYKKTIKYLFSREGRHDRYDYVGNQGISYYTDHKEYFLKQLNKKKDEKKKLRRREDSV